MFERINIWYDKLTPVKQLCISFLATWSFWLTTSLILDKFILEEKHSIVYQLFYATWMAFFMTIFFNYKKVSSLFKNK
jgi:hypothetical protein